MEEYLAFDIGGTNIKYGVIDEQGNILSHSLIETEAHLGASVILKKIIKIGKQHRKYNISGVAISTAGQVDFETGTIVGATDTIPNYQGLEIRRLVSEALQLPVEVRNDADCAGLCEKWLGEQKTSNYLTITIGTGIGGAIVLNQEMYSGHTYSAGEWGNMLIEGERFEDVASMTGLGNMAKGYLNKDNWTGEEIFRLYDQNDVKMDQIVSRFFKHLAIGIANLIYIFNPEKVVIGGAITGRGEVFLMEVQQAVRKYLNPLFYKNTEITLAKHTNYSGMLGAVYHFIERQS